MAQKPYSLPCTVSQNDTGRFSVNEKRTIDLTDLNPYFHGTARRNGDVVTAGGRVLNVTALGESIRAAREHAYAAADVIRFEGRQLRRDIAA